MKIRHRIIVLLVVLILLIQGYQLFFKKKIAPQLKESSKTVDDEDWLEKKVSSPGQPLLKIIQEGIQRGNNVNQVIHGQSYLARAVQTDNVEAVRLILSTDVNVNVFEEKYNFPPIFLAVKDYVVIPHLVKPKPEATEEEIEKYNGYVERRDSLVKSNKIFNLLIAHGADINLPAKSSETLLHVAIRKARKDLVVKLLTLNADIHAYAADVGKTPLMYAAYYGNWELVQMLMNAGANVHDEADDGETVLSLAQKRTHPRKDKKLYPHIDYDRTISFLKQRGAM